MSKFIQTRDVVLCDDHIDETLDDCLHCRISELEAQLKDRHKRMTALHKKNASLLDAWEDSDMTKKLKAKLKRVEECQNIWLGDGDVVISDVSRADEQWAGICISTDNAPGEVGKHVTYPEGTTTDELDTILIIRTDNTESLRVLIDKCNRAITHLEGYDLEAIK